MARAIGRNDPCPCGSGAKYKRCCLDKGGAEEAPIPEHPWPGSRSLTLEVETPLGVLRRHIPAATPLRLDIEPGPAAEEATQDAAALWGLPDFVYRAELRRLGSGTRELGDGVILIGRLGIVIQVKRRVALSLDPEKEQRWVTKQVAQALRQAQGTIRLLKHQPTRMTNARGRTHEIHADDLRWLSVVIVDHDDVPGDTKPEFGPSDDRAVVLLRRDWEFLFNQLRSTFAVGQYLERVANDPIALGLEPVRYHELALADAKAKPEALDPALLVGNAHQVSTPLLPLRPAGSEDRPAHVLYRTIFEDIALTDMKKADEHDRLMVLAELDRLPVGQRENIGRFLLDGFAKVAHVAPPAVQWEFRSVRAGLGKAHLGFAICSRFNDDIQAGFTIWVQLRHHQLQEKIGDPNLTTVGVLLTPRHDGRRPWDTTMSAVSGELAWSEEDLATCEAIWPIEGTAA